MQTLGRLQSSSHHLNEHVTRSCRLHLRLHHVCRLHHLYVCLQHLRQPSGAVRQRNATADQTGGNLFCNRRGSVGNSGRIAGEGKRRWPAGHEPAEQRGGLCPWQRCFLSRSWRPAPLAGCSTKPALQSGAEEHSQGLIDDELHHPRDSRGSAVCVLRSGWSLDRRTKAGGSEPRFTPGYYTNG